MSLNTPDVAAFEQLARDLLAAHPELRHEWRPIRSRFWSDRLDLVLAPLSSETPEVWVTLRPGQLTVGDSQDHTDFETWGRPISDEDLAREAFEHFVTLLREHGYLH